MNNIEFAKKVRKLRSEGLSESEIASRFEMSTPAYRKRVSESFVETREAIIKEIRDAKDRSGKTNRELADEYGVSENYVRMCVS